MGRGGAASPELKFRGGARLRLAGAQRSRCSGGRFNLCSPGWRSPGARVGRRCSAAACSGVNGDGERWRTGEARGGGAVGVLRAPGSHDSTREGLAKVQRSGVTAAWSPPTARNRGGEYEVARGR